MPRYSVNSEEPRVLTCDGAMVGTLDTPELAARVAALLNAPDGDARQELSAAQERLRFYRDRMQMTPSERQSYLDEDADESVEPERSFLRSAQPARDLRAAVGEALAQNSLGTSSDLALDAIRSALRTYDETATSLLRL